MLCVYIYIYIYIYIHTLNLNNLYILNLNLNMILDTTHTPPHVTFRRNLHSFSPSRLSAMDSSLLPPPKHLSSLDADSATDTFCSTLMSCLDYFCTLSSRPTRTSLSASWLTFSANIVLSSGLQKGYGANHKIILTLIYIDHSSLNSLLMSPLLKWTYYHDKINNSPYSRMLFNTFSFLLFYLIPPPSSTLTVDNFATFFINTITNLTAQFSTPQTVKLTFKRTLAHILLWTLWGKSHKTHPFQSSYYLSAWSYSISSPSSHFSCSCTCTPSHR